MKGFIHSFQTLGAVDGPGLRFVVFLQGCNLRCLYCHNPDAWAEGCGTVYAPEEVLERVLRYRPYFGAEGGLTVSGGEPMLQAEFVYELFLLCRLHGVRTCLDTSGQPMGEWTEKLLSVADLCLLDIKANDDKGYHEVCGLDLLAPIRFLNMLETKKIATWVRQVIVPGRNDGIEDIEKLNALLAPYSCIGKVELLPFHTLCLEKYRQLGIPFPLEHTPPMDEAKIKVLSRHLRLPH